MHMFMNIHRYCFIEAFKPLTRTATKGKYYLISLLNYFLGGQLYRIQLRWTGFVSTLKPFSSFNKGESSCCFIDFFHQLLCILYEIIIWKNTWSIYLQYNFQFYLIFHFFLSAISIVFRQRQLYYSFLPWSLFYSLFVYAPYVFPFQC